MSKIVTFEQAKMLKELGFDGECLYWYNEYGVKECPIEQGYMEYYYEADCFLNDWNAKKIDRDLYGSYPPKESYSAPTVCDALDWVREEKGVMCAVELIRQSNRFGGVIGYKYGGVYIAGYFKEVLLPALDTHPLASSALLDAVLTYLEQKEKP